MSRKWAWDWSVIELRCCPLSHWTIHRKVSYPNGAAQIKWALMRDKVVVQNFDNIVEAKAFSLKWNEVFGVKNRYWYVTKVEACNRQSVWNLSKSQAYDGEQAIGWRWYLKNLLQQVGVYKTLIEAKKAAMDISSTME